MSDTNDMRGEFEAWFSDEGAAPQAVTRKGSCYELMLANQAWMTWQAATERATAIERERCAIMCEYEQAKTDSTAKLCLVVADLRPYDICAAAIRQGGDT